MAALLKGIDLSLATPLCAFQLWSLVSQGAGCQEQQHICFQPINGKLLISPSGLVLKRRWKPRAEEEMGCQGFQGTDRL